jgi:hypothetical protein
VGTFKGNNGEKDQHNRMGITSNPRNSQRTDRIPLPTKWFLAAHRWNWRTALRLRRQPDAHARRRQHRMALRGHAARTRRTGLRANHPTRPPAVVHHHDVQPQRRPATGKAPFPYGRCSCRQAQRCRGSACERGRPPRLSTIRDRPWQRCLVLDQKTLLLQLLGQPAEL